MAFALAVTHPFVSGIADAGDASLVQPSNWNAAHTVAVSGATQYGVLLADTTTSIGQVAGFTFGGSAAGTGLYFAAGTATTDVNALNLTQTWNAAGVAFSGIKGVFTQTASAAASYWINLADSAGTNSFLIGKNGSIVRAGGANIIDFNPDGVAGGNNSLRMATNGFYPPNSNQVDLGFAGGGFSWKSLQLVGRVGWDSAGTVDTALTRISAGLLGAGTGAAGSFAGGLKLTDLTINRAATFLTTSLALTDGAGAQVGTLTSSPIAGNPSKWIGINDNGTTRYIPAW